MMDLDFSKEIKDLFGSKFSQQSKSSKEICGLLFSEKVDYMLELKASGYNEKNEEQVEVESLRNLYIVGEESEKNLFRPGRRTAQFAVARVNRFLKGGAQEAELFDSDFEVDFGDIDLDLAKIHLIKAGIEVEDQGEKAVCLGYTEAEKQTLEKPFKIEENEYGVFVKASKNTVLVRFGESTTKEEECSDKTKAGYWNSLFWKKVPVDKSMASDIVDWDEEERLSEWEWDDKNFSSRESLFEADPSLKKFEKELEE